ncbi:HAD family hydrolase [Anabaena subtropica]|uniref:HAD family phosphatase n=1 Tax=Anabaena subtropica FACHB-260 TaxID=2692884 RepID=A0ABR8CTW2_9NOST|nr:HAD family phosphatase [Anabaena subtropica]MBD2346328.1 HAD family phosphatase [Anabaena subtropica FACHB-260]
MLKNIRAAIFDMDGLLFDTESIARWAWQQALTSHGYIMSGDFYNEFVGRDLTWREKILKQRYGNDFPFDAVKSQRIEIGDRRELQEGLPMKAGALNLLCQLHSLEIVIALATGTSRSRTIRRLSNAGILHYFTTIVTSEDVPEGKPAPDIYLEVSRRIHVTPVQCVVFEDSCVGIEAAFSAGMYPIMIPDIEHPSPEIRCLTYKVLDSLEQASQLLEERLGTRG